MRKDLTSSLVMQFQVILCVDAKIIHVDFKPLFGDHVRKDVIHECLEGWWGVTFSPSPPLDAPPLVPPLTPPSPLDS